VVFLAACVLLVAFVLHPQLFPGGETLHLHLRGKKTVDDRVQEYSAAVQTRLSPYFQRAGVLYPPQKVILLCLKAEKRLEVYAADAGGKMKFIHAYKVLGASGEAGPKLREGDLQVPEGVYRIESLNPNSAFHLALRVNYPNQWDRAHAAREGRGEIGSDIMIHGSNASIGCLAMGDEAAEELFVLAAQTGLDNIEVLLCPGDFRNQNIIPPPHAPAWTAELYKNLQARVDALDRGDRAERK
jgi:hypothetical protein